MMVFWGMGRPEPKFGPLDLAPEGPWRPPGGPLEAPGASRTAWKRLENPHMHGVTSTDPNIYNGLQYIQ